jgi:hypothetical protein
MVALTVVAQDVDQYCLERLHALTFVAIKEHHFSCRRADRREIGLPDHRANESLNMV